MGWMEYGWILSQFGSGEGSGARMYRKFVERGMEEGVESPLTEVVGQVLLGGEEMLGKVKRLLGGKEIGQDVVERRSFKDRPSAEEIISGVASVLGTDELMITGRGRKGSEARGVALYLVKRYAGLSNREIGLLFGGIHSSGVTKASGRMEERMKRDAKIRALVETVISKVKA
jgi:hypothetical protein